MKDINKRLEVLEETMAKMQDIIDDIRRESKEDPNKITVGDVVRRKYDDAVRFVVFYVDNDEKAVSGITKDGAWRSNYISEVEKTGEHIYSTEEVLALLKEGEE